MVVAELLREYDMLHHRVQLIHQVMQGGTTIDYALACTYGSKVGALVKILRGISTVPGGGEKVLVVSFWGNTLLRIQGILQRCALNSVFYRTGTDNTNNIDSFKSRIHPYYSSLSHPQGILHPEWTYNVSNI